MPCGIAAGARELQLCCQEEEKVAVASCRVVGFRVFVLGFGILIVHLTTLSLRGPQRGCPGLLSAFG